ncbi:MAG: HAMP domain-containing protein [Desulfamplus sp.]|nr:HAMP domain-containing protein [Desulfamplus sp.]
MFQSLRWRIVAAFVLIIILSISASNLLAVWTTRSQFNDLVTEAGFKRAVKISVLLEAQYNLHGAISPKNLVNEYIKDKKTDSVYHYDRWEKIIASELGVSYDIYKKERYEKSIVDLTKIYDVNTQKLISAIMLAEQQTEKTQPEKSFHDFDHNSDGLISPDEADWFKEKGKYFDRNKDGAISLQEWNAAIGLNQHGRSSATPYHGNNVSISTVKKNPKYKDGDIEENTQKKLFVLSATLYKAKEYINNSPPTQITRKIQGDKKEYIMDTLLGDSRMFVTDENGIVIFDSKQNGLKGKTLDNDMMALGIAIYDWRDSRAVGYVIIAAGEDFYSEDENRFLKRVRKLLIIGGLIAAGTALILGAFFARRITAPVKTLTDAARRLAMGDHNTLLPVTSNDEMGEMTQAFNTLTQALNTQLELRRRLIADISHELNTPLSVIRLEMKALQDGLQSSSEASAHVVREIDLLRSLADDLSLLVDTERGTLSLNLELTEIGVFMKTAISRWQPKAESGGITLQLETSANLPEMTVDPVRLSQVLGNLIENALKHTSSGGQIIVTCQTGNLPEKSGEWLITTIRDTGCGIAPEDLPFVFERFYRTDQSRQRKTGGRGLGLSIVEKIITLHNGIVWADSSPGEGSCFSFALPVP